MKYLKKFKLINEDLKETLDIKEISEIFRDVLVDDYDLRYIGLIEDKRNVNEEKEYFYLQFSSTELDEDGKTEYQSYKYKNRRDFHSNPKVKNYYTITCNITTKLYKDEEFLKQISLISKKLSYYGYYGNYWYPEYNCIRFHIATKESNPFINKPYLDKYYGGQKPTLF